MGRAVEKEDLETLGNQRLNKSLKMPSPVLPAMGDENPGPLPPRPKLQPGTLSFDLKRAGPRH
jgi:hypothetical protein